MNGLSLYDEGLAVYGANRILNGDLPYRDFWTIYPPGQFYILAVLFKLFGPTIIVERIFTVIVKALISIFLYLIIERVAQWWLGLIPWLLITFWFAGKSYGSPIPTALLFTVLSCLSLAEFFHKHSKKWLLLTGVFTGITACFRHDLGTYTFIAESALIIAFQYTNVTNYNNPMRKLSKTMRSYYLFLLGVIAVMLPIGIFFISTVNAREMFSNLIVFPATVLPEYRALPYPPPCPNPLSIMNGELTIRDFIRETSGAFPFYLPIVIFIMTGLKLIHLVRIKHSFRPPDWVLILMFLLVLFFFNQARVRSDVVHLTPMMIPTVIMLPLLLFVLSKQAYGKWNRLLRYVLFATLIMVSLWFTRRLTHLIQYKLRLSPSIANMVPLDLSRSKGIRVEPTIHELQIAVQYIQDVVPPEGKIFVGNYRHDMIYANNIMFYFLVDRHSATKFHELHPGLATTRSIQREIIDELIKQRVNYIVLWNGYESFTEPNESGKSSGVTDLDEFIQSNYSEVKTIGHYRILFLKDAF